MAELKVVLSADTKKATDDLQKVSVTIKDVDKSAQLLKSLNAILNAIEKNTLAASNGFKELAGNLKKVPEKPPVDPEPIKRFTGTIGVLTDRLPRLRGALLNATDPAKIDRLNKIIAETQLRIKSLSSTALPNLTKTTGGANIALTNFGRVVQDAPFGIIGIANNIDPLISSFQNLQRSTGSTGGAFKALAGALAGPAGIAIGVSAVTSALITFGPQISAAISGVNNLEQAQRDAAEKGAGAFIEAQQEFSKLLTIVSESSNSFSRQNDALKDANNLLGDYGLKIKDVANFQKIGAQVGILYAQIKQEEAKAAVLAGKAAEVYAQNVLLGIKAQQGDVGILFDFKAGDLIKNLTGAITPLEAVKQLTDGFSNAIQANNQEQQAFQKEADKTQSSVSELINELKNITGITEDFGEKTKKAKVENNRLAFEVKELTGAFQSSIKSVRPATDGLTELISKEEALTIALRNRKNAQIEAANAITNRNAESLASGQTTTPASLGNLTIPTGIADQQQRINEEAAIGANSFAAIQSSVAETQAIFNTLTPLVDQTFSAIANGENAFDAIGQGVKRLIVDLIKAAALAAIVSAVSGGSTSFLGAFKGLVGLKPFARGATVFGPTPALVGEAGPEAIIPLSQLANIIGNVGGGGNVNVTGAIRGNDIYLTNQRGGSSYSRLFG